jgi:diamine N-acetyltransferase
MSKIIQLRDPEDTDVPFLLNIENDLNNQFFSSRLRFYSENEVKYFVQKKQNLLMDLQYRYMIIHEFKPVGCIDLIDFDLVNSRAELGILIEEKYRRNGFGYGAIEEIKSIIHKEHSLKQIYAEVLSNNLPSIHLFEKSGFQECGCKKKWIRKENGFVDLNLYQFFFK